jgi:hypothetical protein
MISFFKKLFKKKKSDIKLGSCFAVLKGDYYGEIFVLFEYDNDSYKFVSLPTMKVREVKKEKFNIGISDKIIEYFKILPKNVYKVIEEHGKNTIKGK